MLLLKCVIMLFHTTPTYSIYQVHNFVEVMRKKFTTGTSYSINTQAFYLVNMSGQLKCKMIMISKRSQDKAQNQ